MTETGNATTNHVNGSTIMDALYTCEFLPKFDNKETPKTSHSHSKYDRKDENMIEKKIQDRGYISYWDPYYIKRESNDQLGAILYACRADDVCKVIVPNKPDMINHLKQRHRDVTFTTDFVDQFDNLYYRHVTFKCFKCLKCNEDPFLTFAGIEYHLRDQHNLKINDTLFEKKKISAQSAYLCTHCHRKIFSSVNIGTTSFYPSALVHWQQEHPHLINYTNGTIQLNLIDSNNNEKKFLVNKSTKINSLKRKFLETTNINIPIKHVKCEYDNTVLLDSDSAAMLNMPNKATIFVKIEQDLNQTENLDDHSSIFEYDDSAINELSQSLSMLETEDTDVIYSHNSHKQLDFPKPFMVRIDNDFAKCAMCGLEFHETIVAGSKQKSSACLQHHLALRHSELDKFLYQKSETNNNFDFKYVLGKLGNLSMETDDTLIEFYKILITQAKRHVFRNEDNKAEEYFEHSLKLLDEIKNTSLPVGLFRENIYMIRSSVYIKTKNYNLAEKDCNRILHKDNASVCALVKRAITFKLRNFLEPFKAELKKILSIEPKHNFAIGEWNKIKSKEGNCETLDLTCLYENANLSGREIFASKDSKSNPLSNLQLDGIFFNNIFNIFNIRIRSGSDHFKDRVGYYGNICNFNHCYYNKINYGNGRTKKVLSTYHLHNQVCHENLKELQQYYICKNYTECRFSISKSNIDFGSYNLLLNTRYFLNLHMRDEAYDYRFTSILKKKKRLPLNQLNIITFNIGGLLRKQQIVYESVLRSPFLLEIINFQLSGRDIFEHSFNIPGYKCIYDGRQVVTYVCFIESHNLKIFFKKKEIESILASTEYSPEVMKKMDLLSVEVYKTEIKNGVHFANTELKPVNINNVYIRPVCEDRIILKHFSDFIKIQNEKVSSGIFKEAIHCGDFNTPGVAFVDQKPLKATLKGTSNSSWLYKLFNKQKDLYQHVNFPTHNSNLIECRTILDLVCSTFKNSIINVHNGGEIRNCNNQYWLHSCVCFEYYETAGNKISLESCKTFLEISTHDNMYTNGENCKYKNAQIGQDELNNFKKISLLTSNCEYFLFDTFRYIRGIEETSFTMKCKLCLLELSNGLKSHSEHKLYKCSIESIKEDTRNILNSYGFTLI
jgi:hypothetical protein